MLISLETSMTIKVTYVKVILKTNLIVAAADDDDGDEDTDEDVDYKL